MLISEFEKDIIYRLFKLLSLAVIAVLSMLVYFHASFIYFC